MSSWNPWKTTAIGMALVIATALITGLVVANWNRADTPPGSPQPDSLATQPSAAVPPPTAVATAPAPVTAPTPAAPPAPARSGGATRVRSSQAPPAQADVDACNGYATAQAGNKTTETVTDALIGAAAGAGVGAAGGAIAGGGKGAGKGAGIGGLVGAAAGTLYGLNQGKSHDARYVQAYRACMKARGHTG